MVMFIQFLIKRLNETKYGYRLSDKYILVICAFLSSVPNRIRKKCKGLDIAIERIIELSLKKVLTFIDGVKYYLADYDSLLVVSKEYEAPIRKFLDLKEGDIFVDVGAHIGKYALRIAKEFGQKSLVVAIEPSPKVYAILVKNINLNRLRNIIAINKAAYNKKAKLRLYRTKTFSMYSIKKDYDMGFVEIEAETLDSILEKLNVIGIKWTKIDVEQAEIEVLEGFRNTITRDKPRIIIECQKENEERLVKFMKENGYQVSNRIKELPGYICIPT